MIIIANKGAIVEDDPSPLKAGRAFHDCDHDSIRDAQNIHNNSGGMAGWPCMIRRWSETWEGVA